MKRKDPCEGKLLILARKHVALEGAVVYHHRPNPEGEILCRARLDDCENLTPDDLVWVCEDARKV